MGSKKCKRCEQVKDESEFYTRRWKKKTGYAEGLDPWCTPCRLSYHKKNYTEKLKEGDPWLLSCEIVNRMKDRTKKSGYSEAVEFSNEDVFAIIKDGVCSKTGISFSFCTSGTNKKKNPFVPSPDRLDNTKGYTKDNVQWVVFIYNAMKNNFDASDVEKFVAALKERDGF